MPTTTEQLFPAKQCKATAKNTGQQCKKPAIKGLEVCEFHGGATKRSKKAAHTRVQKAKLEHYLDKLGLKKQGLTPEQLMQELVERTGADLEYLAFEASTGEPLWVDAYTDALDRATRVAKAAIDAGLMERQTQVQEAEATLLVQVVMGALADLGLTPEVQTQAKKAIATRLRQIES